MGRATPDSAGRTTTGAAGGGSGQIDKRRAILTAAFTVFARRGYAGACVKEVAQEAGVAKPTVYNHLHDKENLFRQAMQTAADTVADECVAVLDRLRAPGDDLPAALEDVAHRLLQVCRGERAVALRWLTHGQVAEFPDLVVDVHGRTAVRIADALADRLARFALAGRLRVADPARAAEQLLAMLTGPLELRTRLGTRRISVAESREIAAAAVDTFLSAYGP
ncbi:TetR/AcrR family transcriptional regulator [Streptomyces uncialis]|uniref:TetR/AcrR family transcriptional regulator n=1 Tax=Streptomyces uncialis TaxID=1048205 RepID=UPI002E3166AD|nr:TetR/AcrR family transcriptional regulator [Streptomyces uncialis]